MAQRPKSTVSLITGNQLASGRVVYLRADRTWGADIDAARTFADAAERDAELAWAKASFETVITGIYTFDVGIAENGERLMSARETLRAQGEVATRRRMGFGG